MPPKIPASNTPVFQKMNDAIQQHFSIANAVMEVVPDINQSGVLVFKITFSRTNDARTFATQIHQRYHIGSQASSGQAPKPYTNHTVYFTLDDITAFFQALGIPFSESIDLIVDTSHNVNLIDMPNTHAQQAVSKTISAGDFVVKTFRNEHDLDFILNQMRDPELNRSNYSRYRRVFNRAPAATRTKRNLSTGQIVTYTRQPNKTNTHTKKTSTTLMPPNTALMSLFCSNYIGMGFNYHHCEQKPATYLFSANALSDTYFWCSESLSWQHNTSTKAMTLTELQARLKQLPGPTSHTEWLLGLPNRQIDVLFVQKNTHQDRLALLAKMYKIKTLFQLTHDIPLWILHTAGSPLPPEKDSPPFGPYYIAAQLMDLLRDPTNGYDALIDPIIEQALETLVELQLTLENDKIRWMTEQLVALNQKYNRARYHGMDAPKYKDIALLSQDEAWINHYPMMRQGQPLPLREWMRTHEDGEIIELLSHLTHGDEDQPFVVEIYTYAVKNSNLTLLKQLLKTKLYVLTPADIVALLSSPSTDAWRNMEEWYRVVKTYAPSWASVAPSSLSYTELVRICTSEDDLKQIITRESLTLMFNNKPRWPLLHEVLRHQAWRSHLVAITAGGLFNEPLFTMPWLLACIEQHEWMLFSALLSFMEKQKNLSQFPSLDAQKHFVDLVVQLPEDQARHIEKYFQKNPIALTWEDSNGRSVVSHWLEKNNHYIEQHLPDVVQKLKPTVIMNLLDQIESMPQPVSESLRSPLLAAMSQHMKNQPSIIFMKNAQHRYALRHLVMHGTFAEVTQCLKSHPTEAALEINALMTWAEEWLPSSPTTGLAWLTHLLIECKVLCAPHIARFTAIATRYDCPPLLRAIHLQSSNAPEPHQFVSDDTPAKTAAVISNLFRSRNLNQLKEIAANINNPCIRQFCNQKYGSMAHTRILGKLVFKSRLDRATTATEVQAILREFRTLDKSLQGCFFKRQGFLKLCFHGYRFGTEEMSRTGTEFHKLAKNRLLELASQNNITATEEAEVTRLLSTPHTRFSIFKTTSSKIYDLLRTDRVTALRLLQEEQFKIERRCGLI